MSRPLQISADTAVRLAKELNVPLEHLMHMPRHILLQKMAELARTMPDSNEPTVNEGSADSTNDRKPGDPS
ncbi:YycC family protein [Paenibacillus pasadenensis]|uniref:YycC family protein n=1 Tax=Paenibacillus pasadenensis TaxID=217090 RepID=UPI00203D4FBD|nr:YycC family protein [Paenibacillus pasadenensis]MCM3749693.1 YycC family protein [Paenibacillus pasadenensis]